MKKTLIPIIVSMLLVLMSGCDKPSTTNHQRSANLVHNGSFEQGISAPDGWHTKNQFLNDITGWVTEESHSGKHSLKIENISGSDAYWQGKEIVLDKPANVLEAGIWTKTKDIRGKNGEFKLVLDVYLQGNAEVKKVVIRIPQTIHDWEQVKTKTMYKENIAKIVPYIYFSGNIGTVYADDLNINLAGISDLANNGKILFDSNANGLFSPSIKSTLDENKERIYEITGNQGVTSADFIPIETNNKLYKLSGMFKSAGKEANKLYFGYIAYTKNKDFINKQSFIYERNTETELARSCTKDDTVIYIRNGINWVPAGYACIAFNTDNSGKYADLPNFNLSSYGLNEITPLGKIWRIELSEPCGKSYPVNTKVREHTSDRKGNYIYNAACEADLPITWTEYSVVMFKEGEFEVERNYENNFPQGTRYVKIFIMAKNESLPDGVLMDFKNIKMREIELN